MLRHLLQEMRFRRNGIIGWGLAVSMLPLLYITIYPSFADQMAGFQEIMDLAIYQALGISMADFESYIASTVINIAPLLVSIYAIISATGTLAGEEDDGRLELIVALPIPRWRIVATKAAAQGIALFLVLLIAGIIAGGAFASIQGQVETTVTAVDVTLALLYAWPIVMAVSMIGLFLGTFCPSRRIAALITTAIFLVGYFGSNLSGMVTSLESIRPLFLFNYFDASADMLRNGAQAGDIAVLLGVALAAFGLALLFFQWRNLTVGAWPWQRGRIPV